MTTSQVTTYSFACVADARARFLKEGFITVDESITYYKMNKIVDNNVKESVVIQKVGFLQVIAKHIVFGDQK